MAANQVDFKILPSDQFSVYSPQTRSDKVITYFTLLSKLRGDILSVGQEDDPNNIVSAFYINTGNVQTLHLVKADGSEVTASNSFAGTVTSVDMSVPTGFSISGNPITTSGTLAVGFASGYSLPTNAIQATWTTAYNRSLTSAAVTGTSTKTLTLNQQDGGTITASWSDIDTGLTSVGLTMPAAFSVANSPLTANGTLAVTAAGLSSQYIRGDGQLANFPTPGGGGSSVNYYLNGSVSQGTFGGDTYYELSKTPIAGAGTNFTRTSASGDGYVASFITDANDPDQINIPGGNWNLEFYFNSSSSGGSPAFYGELYKVSVSNVFTLIASGSVNPESITGGTSVDQYYTSIAVPQTALLATDRLAIRVYVIVSGRNITLHTENSNFSEVITTFSTGLNSLNGLSDQVQYFAVGTSGTDFAISSSLDTHTFNLPTASATNRGALSSADWTTFNSKEPALTKGNLTEATSAVLTITGGTGAVIGTGTTIQVAQSGVSTSGFLSSTDWNTFNGKQNAITLTTTGSTGAATLIGATLNIPNYADQFVGTVTSVNMSVPTGFAISGNPITTSGTLAVAFASGYSLPTNASQTTWNTAYNDSITAFAYNTSTAVLTLTQQDAGTLTATVTLQPFSTSNLAEGTNLYYTDTRARLALSAGTGISYSTTTGVITNSAPDLTVVLTASTGISVTGTYPSFTITNTSTSSGGTVTSIATTAPITGGTITTTGTIGITQSGAAADGYLSSTDWNTFNNKQNALTNPVTGTGTTNYVTKWTSASAIGDSAIYDNAGNIGIGTTSPAYKLHVQGSGVLATFRNSSTGTDQYTQLEFIAGSRDAYIWLGNQNTTSWAGDGGLNIYTGTGNMDFWTAGTQKMRLTASGNLGIGTTNPQGPLEVYKSNSGGLGGHIILNNNGLVVGNETAILFNDSGVGSVASVRAAISSTVEGSPYLGDIKFKTGATTYGSLSTRMIITGAGNVGIGTTAPSTKLEVGNFLDAVTNKITVAARYEYEPEFNFRLGQTGTGYDWIGAVISSGDDGNYNGKILFKTANAGRDTPTTKMVIKASGRVGIGTTDPISKLHVYDDSDVWHTRIGGASGELRIGGQTSSGAVIQAYTPAGAARDLYIQRDGGNVGIGTTAPGAKLDVRFDDGVSNGEHNVLASFSRNGSGPLVIGYRANGTSVTSALIRIGDALPLTIGTTSSNQAFTLLDNGNVGIGNTNPTAKLQVGAEAHSNATGIEVAAGAGGANLLALDSSTNHNWFPYTDGSNYYSAVSHTFRNELHSTDWMKITSAGNVGIGTTSPGFKLTIVAASATDSDILLAGMAGVSNGFTVKRVSSSFVYSMIDGGLGINNAAPTQALHVTGNARVTGAFIDSGNSAGTSGQILSSTATGTSWIAAPSGTITGSGTTNYVPKWTSGSAIGDSAIYDNAGNIGIGTTAPGAKLDIIAETRISYATSSQYRVRITNSDGNGRILVDGDESALIFGTSVAGTNATATERMRITSAGNVLIGTTVDNSYKLRVSGKGYFDNNVVITPTSESWAEGLSFVMPTSTTWGGLRWRRERVGDDGNWYIGFTALDATDDLVFGANNGGAQVNNIIRLTKAGNVGIGTTSPLNLLHVSQASANTIFRLGNNASYDQFIYFNGGNDWSLGMDYSNSNAFVLSNSSSIGTNDRVVVTTAGNVGIGTTAPNSKLSVNGGDFEFNRGTGALGNYYVVINKGTSNDGGIILKRDNASDFQIVNQAGNGNLTFYAYGAASEVLTILRSNGNVGIGTTSPGSKFSVNGSNSGSVPLVDLVASGSGAFQRGVRMLNSGMVASDSIMYSAGRSDDAKNMGQFYFTFAGAGSNSNRISMGLHSVDDVLNIMGSGNVGIGTTAPGANLEVIGSIRNKNASANSNYSQLSTSESTLTISTYSVNTGSYPAPIIFSPNLSERMRITDAGNVGIGTTGPTYKLHVVGGPLGVNIGTASTNQAAAQFVDSARGLTYMPTVAGGAYNWASVTDGSALFNTTGSDWWVGNHDGSALRFVQNSSLVFYTNSGAQGIWNSTGLGIGTTGPTEKLHVDGSTLITYNNSFQSTNSVGNKAILARVSPTSGIINYAEYATATNLNGFVIGSDDARVKGNIATDSLEFITNTSTRMTILSGGNVGINTTTPGSTLHVIGDVLIQTGALGVGVNPNATDGRIDASNDIVAFSTSDRRLKENITPIANALEKVRSLTGVEFDWKEETKSVHGYEGHDVGVIAQDVQAVLPEAVRTNDSGYLSVRYEKMIALLVEANKELADRVEQLEKLIK